MFGSLINSLEELDLAGYQIVPTRMFKSYPRKRQALCTLWTTKIGFNRVALQMLENCEYVRMEVNPQMKGLLIIPVSSSDKDAIRWAKGTKELYTRNLESKPFAAELYRMWNLDLQYNYRATGKLVTSGKKVMLLFDFAKAEVWQSQSRKAGMTDG